MTVEPTPALDHAAYTVGWVCALPKEQTAAIAMLDQRHPNIPNMQLPTDTNAYTLGSIGDHNIVIACLPKGQIGVVSAATVATNMVSSFSSIKIGLLVGIGGGIPSNKVRLGDVVVSTPIGTYPGVVQWDLGKAKEAGNFERTGSLNNPPTFLLATLTKLETAHEMGGSRIDEYLDELGKKFPRLASKYLRSDARRDVLFKADCAHVDIDDTSSSSEDESDACRYCDKTKAKERKLRPTRIHYGLIASGNQVIKDSIFRDKLNKDLGGNVLCVEMEAAGLMANFPCIVIRGICDYADSHKNNLWQEHAAAVAAACAKEFLAYIEPQTIRAEPSAQEVIKNIQQIVYTIELGAEQLRSSVKRREKEEILEWLTPLHYGNQQSDFLAKHQPGTGQWFLDSEPFKTWLSLSGKTLFCPGIPGSGKTIIASLVIQCLGQRFHEDSEVGLAYIFCDDRRSNEQSLNDVLASLLKQISQTGEALPENVVQLRKRHSKLSTRPSSADLLRALITTAKCFKRVMFVVDALDELQSSDDCRSDIIAYLERVQREAKVNILYTSRHIMEIEKVFNTCLKQPIRASDEDVAAFIATSLPRALRHIKKNRQLEHTIKSRIMRLVDGMFLLAHLYINAIKDATSVTEVRQILMDLQDRRNKSASDNDRQDALHQAYDRAMERIASQRPNLRELGMKTLAWVVHARRYLTKGELRHALAINSGDNRLDSDNLRNIETILSTCAGLVIINRFSDVICLAHFTTQEYFNSKKMKYFPNAQLDIASACASYLCFGGSSSPLSKEAADKQKHFVESQQNMRIRLAPPLNFGSLRSSSSMSYWAAYSVDRGRHLLAYAAVYWGHHTREATTIPHSVFDLFDDEDKCHFLTWLNLIIYPKSLGRDSKRNSNEPEWELAENGFHGIGLYLEGNRNSPDEDDLATTDWEAFTKAYHQYAMDPGAVAGGKFHLATSYNILPVVRNWILAGPGIVLRHIEKLDGMDPLMIASREGFESIARLLLENGANIQGTDLKGNTALIHATHAGHESIAVALIQAGADTEIRDHLKRTPFMYAWEIGTETMMNMLLENGANPDATYGKYTALMQACMNRSESVVNKLLDRGANIEARDSVGRTPLMQVSEAGLEIMVDLLLKRGADIHAVERGWTLLGFRSLAQHDKVASMLERKGATIDKNNMNRRFLWLSQDNTDGEADLPVGWVVEEKGQALEEEEGRALEEEEERPLEEEEGRSWEHESRISDFRIGGIRMGETRIGRFRIDELRIGDLSLYEFRKGEVGLDELK